jgi:hypothetical protein
LKEINLLKLSIWLNFKQLIVEPGKQLQAWHAAKHAETVRAGQKSSISKTTACGWFRWLMLLISPCFFFSKYVPGENKI